MYRYFLSYVTLQCFILLLWTWSKWWFLLLCDWNI
jgi:hypothetical protein